MEVMSDGTRIPIHANWINTSPDVDGNTQKFIATQVTSFDVFSHTNARGVKVSHFDMILKKCGRLISYG